jgi:hypothetical protein
MKTQGQAVSLRLLARTVGKRLFKAVLISGVIETPCPETPLSPPLAREPIPPSQGESPFPLDLYLSWMSPPDARSRAAAIGQLCGLARQHWYRRKSRIDTAAR